jgi:hypothetical protein|tara:strand:+ start:660 stop:1004 length:345 start_codon:yes stop_codon:yes gene_type:complete
MGLDMSAFDKAWALLKAIPSQQELLGNYESTEHLPIYDDEEYGIRFRSFGTMHPQAQSMSRRAAEQGKTRGYPLLEREPRQGDKGAASEEARKDEERPYSMIMQGYGEEETLDQ